MNKTLSSYPSKEVGILKGHQGSVLTIKFSSDGNYCVSGGSDKNLRLWNPHKSLLIKTYTGHGWEVYDLVISTDNSRVASCGGDRLVFLWDVGTGRVVRKFQGHLSRVNCIAFNHELEYVSSNADTCTVLITGGYDKTVRIWDCRSNGNQPIMVLEEAKDSISSLFTTKYEIIAGSVDGNVRTYDIRKGSLCTDCIAQPITSVQITHDTNCFLLSCLDNTVRLLDRGTGELLNEYKGHKNSSYKIDSLLTNDDAYVISGSEDNQIFIWDLVEAKPIAMLKGHQKEVCSLAMSSQDAVLLSGSVDGTIRIWK